MKEIFAENNLNLTENMFLLLDKYTELLLDANQKINLTAITDRREIYIKHYLDSLLGERFFSKNATVIDVGSGAGFPAIPLKIYRNDLKITMLDSLNKRVNFLRGVINELELEGIMAVHLRAEDGGRGSYREQFDFAVARAVADMSVLAEYCLPFVKIGGKFVAYKGGEAEEETERAERAIELLGGRLVGTEKFVLPDGGGRSIITVEKVRATPLKYPRGQNKPRISPL